MRKIFVFKNYKKIFFASGKYLGMYSSFSKAELVDEITHERAGRSDIVVRNLFVTLSTYDLKEIHSMAK
jgi:hypothetical protein